MLALATGSLLFGDNGGRAEILGLTKFEMCHLANNLKAPPEVGTRYKGLRSIPLGRVRQAYP